MNLFEFLTSKEGDRLIWNVLMAIILIAGFAWFMWWVKRRDAQHKADNEKDCRVFQNEIDVLIDDFMEAQTRRYLLHLELKIDSFYWYWLARIETDKVNAAREKLYEAFYTKLNTFKVTESFG